jgi:hypothetical protein
MRPRSWTNIRSPLAALVFLAVLAWTGVAGAQLPIPASSQFDMTGFIQEATLDASCAADAHCGGTIKVNGHVVTVPKETIVIFPANALSWQELFVQAPLPWGTLGTAINTSPLGGPTSGMARADCAVVGTTGCTAGPLTTWEAQVIGNRVVGATPNEYIAGLIYVSQQGLNSGAGFINFIDYTLGEMRVGGPIGSSTLGARVRINDPAGRYGRATTSPDIRFTVDPDNPTISAGSGYPMCLPRTAPSGVGVGTDTLCPEQNRPILAAGPPVQYSPSFTMNNLTNPAFHVPLNAGQPAFPRSDIQAPFEVGDYITFAGTLVKDFVCSTTTVPCPDADGPTVGPMPALGAASTYIAAHTIENNVSILTFQGSNPVYVRTDVTILGTGGLIVLGVGEAAVRTRFEGMMSDLTRAVHLFGMDLTSAGTESDRDFGTIGVDPGPPLGAVTGRWRFRPPCAPFGTVPTKPDKQCVMNQAGTFLPPTREVRAVVYDPAVVLAGTGNGFANPALATSVTFVSNPTTVPPTTTTITNVANGLIWGQYHAPILEYVFPENVPGAPIVENNFNAMPFLACGGYSSSTGTLAGILNPWPSNIAPSTSVCVGLTLPPSNVTLTAAPSTVVAVGGTVVTLTASASGTAPITFNIVQTPAAGEPLVTLTPTGPNTATFVALNLASDTTLNFTVTATNSVGSATASTTVTEVVDTPFIDSISAPPVFSGTLATINIAAVDPDGQTVPPLQFTVTQTNTPLPNTQPLVLTQPVSCAVAFPAGLPALPFPQGYTCAQATFILTLTAGQTAQTLTFDVVATDVGNVPPTPSATVSVAVTVNPLPDNIVISSVEYRTSKQRLIVNAADTTTISPLVDMFLMPYVCENGTDIRCVSNGAGQFVYNPDPAAGGLGNKFTNNGGGLYILDISGGPEPICNGSGTYATPCSQTPIRVQSSTGGISGPSAVTRIRL